MEKTKLTHLIFLLLLATIVAGCSASEDASLIGSYPVRPSGRTEFDSLPSNVIIVYHSQIDLKVGSIPSAVDDIMELAGKYGGYTTYANIWYQETEDHATVIVSVPTFNYDTLYNRITRLGKLQDETVIGELSPSGHHGSSKLEMSTITVHLTEKAFFSLSASEGWKPLNTFSDALRVAAAIFSFLFDVLIWITVVAGPFVLIGWGINHAARRWKITITKKK